MGDLAVRGSGIGNGGLEEEGSGGISRAVGRSVGDVRVASF